MVDKMVVDSLKRIGVPCIDHMEGLPKQAADATIRIPPRHLGTLTQLFRRQRISARALNFIFDLSEAFGRVVMQLPHPVARLFIQIHI